PLQRRQSQMKGGPQCQVQSGGAPTCIPARSSSFRKRGEVSARRTRGDGVNVATRLESISGPGGICISHKVYEDISGKMQLAFVDAGEQQLKNIAQPVRVYRISGEQLAAPRATARPALALPDKPSIAVLPFTNLSGDPEQEYFADGMVEDIITGLSRFSG